MARQCWRRSSLRGVATWVAACVVLGFLAAAWHVPARVIARLVHAVEQERAVPQTERHARSVPASLAPAWLGAQRPLSEVARERAAEPRDPSGATFTPDAGFPDHASALARSGPRGASLPEWRATGPGTRRVCTGGAAPRAPPHAEPHAVRSFL